MAREETRRRMTALVRRWQSSGDTQGVFAQRHGMSRSKFQYWQRQVEPQLGTGAVAFTAVQVHDATEPAAGVVEVALVTGERLVVRPGASADLLRVVLSALRSAC